MRWLYSKTLVTLTLCALQFCMPAISMTTELSCDEQQAEVCMQPPRCQEKATTTQMACCAQPVLPSTDSALTPATVEKTSRMSLDIGASIQPIETTHDYRPVANTGECFSSFNSHLSSNQLYQLLATFLI